MGNITIMNIATPALAAQAGVPQDSNAILPLGAYVLADTSALAQPAAAASDYQASGVAVTGTDPVTPFPVSDATAISGEWTPPAAAVGDGMIEAALHPLAKGALVGMEDPGHQSMTAVTHASETFAMDSSATGDSSLGKWASGELIDVDGGGPAHWTMHTSTAASVSLPSPWMSAEDQLSWWDCGHNLAETLTLQFATDVTNLGVKDAHAFTVL